MIRQGGTKRLGGIELVVCGKVRRVVDGYCMSSEGSILISFFTLFCMFDHESGIKSCKPLR